MDLRAGNDDLTEESCLDVRRDSSRKLIQPHDDLDTILDEGDTSPWVAFSHRLLSDDDP